MDISIDWQNEILRWEKLFGELWHRETCRKCHERNRAMMVAMAKMKVSFVRLLHLLQVMDPQNMCWEQIHVSVWRQLYSHHVVIRRKMELQEFWIQNQVLSTSTSYSSSIQFTCSDRTCIQKIFVCDSRCHCSMGEDEASFCPNALLPIEAPLCNLDQFLCNDGSCTPYTDVCNGRWDCKNGDEEEAFC